MTILPFSKHGVESRKQAATRQRWLADLQAALDGTRDDADARAWRQLQADVRALVPALDPAFTQRLAARLQPQTPSARGSRPRLRLAQLRRRLPRRAGVGAGAAAAAALAAVALLLATPWSSQAPRERAVSTSAGASGRAHGPRTGSRASTYNGTAESFKEARANLPAAGAIHGSALNGRINAEEAAESAPMPQTPAQAAPAFGMFTPGSRRVQQRSATLVLATSPGNVQSVSDRVSAIATEDHGFVRSSHVEAQSGRQSEARMDLSLPSARLSEAIASIERLASVRSKSQSLLDITGSYNAARTRLANAKAERQALLRALANAYTQGQIESLHARLADASHAIQRASTALSFVSHRAKTSEVQVRITGNRSHGTGASGTLGSGLHDAGHVLIVALVVLLIGAAVLVPLGLLAAVLTLAHRLWRRRRREQALDAA